MQPTNTPTKYVQVRHTDYWYGVYGIGKCRRVPPNSVEFSITNDPGGKDFFFHFDFLCFPAMKQMLAENEWLEPDAPQYAGFMQQCTALQEEHMDYFIAGLYYPEGPALLTPWEHSGRTIFDITQNSVPPEYAVLFLREPQPLLPKVLLRWLARLSPSLFAKPFSFAFPHMPSKESIKEEYLTDYRFSEAIPV